VTAEYTERANAIAQALGGAAEPQNAEYENGNFYITLPEHDLDARLLLRFEPHRSKGRLVVTANYPLKSRRRHHVSPSRYVDLSQLVDLGYEDEITVALTKSDAQIAADIQRRMLTAYLAVLKLTRAGLQREEHEDDEQDAMVKRLAEWAGVDLTDHCKQSRRFTRYHQPTSRSLEVDASSETVTVTLKWITPEIAEKAIALFVDSLPKGA
jgi:hypothetical protein